MSAVVRQHLLSPSFLNFALDAMLVFVVFSIVLAQLAGEGGGRADLNVAVAAACFTTVTGGVNAAFGLYRHADVALANRWGTRLICATLVAVPIGCFALKGFEIFEPTAAIVTAILVSAAITLAGSAALRGTVLPKVAARFPRQRILIVGTGARARAVGSFLDALGRGDTVVGYYPTDRREATRVPSARVLATVPPLEALVRTERIDEIIVAAEEQRGGGIPMQALLACRLAGIPVASDAAFFEKSHGFVPIHSLKASYLVYGNGFRQGRVRAFVKRAFDLVVALAMLAVLWPVMVLAALAIRLESRGPVIYSQERVTEGDAVFNILKFRSMRTDAELDGSPRWALASDSRITRVGRFLRRTRIDELPQLLNVVFGEMSFVGPRPERPYFVRQLEEAIPYYRLRHSVKAGITGWAQVRHQYTSTVDGAARKLEYDLYYVKNHSLALDLMILLETVRVVLLGEGAR